MKKNLFDDAFIGKCEQLLKQKVIDISFPGGITRKSAKLILSDHSIIIASQRKEVFQAETERSVLKLSQDNTLSLPKLMGSDSQLIVFQEYIAGKSLAISIHKKNNADIYDYLNKALSSLSKIQLAGSAQGLDERLMPLGSDQNWLKQLIDQRITFSDYFKIPSQIPDTENLMQLLAVRKPRFVKWDARPGNTIIDKNKNVYWIDWEHSGTRNRLDDMVWVLGDEFTPDIPELEDQLLQFHLPHFSDDLKIETARKYFYAWGVFHSLFRLGIIFGYKDKNPWLEYERCLMNDLAGVNKTNALRLAKRAARWASYNEETAVLESWFLKLHAHFKTIE